MSRYAKTDVQKWTKEEILDSLNIEYHGTRSVSKSNGYGDDDNYYYVTNLVKQTSSGTLGAFHWTGKMGGVQMKYQTSTHGETAEEVATHEFGHWLGLPHTWKKNSNVTVVINSTQRGTRDNFMDYKIRRKKWVKRQLLNYDRSKK